MESVRSASLANSFRTISIVGGAIGGFIVLIILAICIIQAYKIYQDSKQDEVGAVWSLEGKTDINDKRQNVHQQSNMAPRITSGEYYMNYLEYSGDDTPVASSAVLADSENGHYPHSLENGSSPRAVHITALSTEDGDIWRQQNRL